MKGKNVLVSFFAITSLPYEPPIYIWIHFLGTIKNKYIDVAQRIRSTKYQCIYIPKVRFKNNYLIASCPDRYD